MKTIEKLTKEQEEYLPIFRDEWLKIGQSTEPMDKEKASIGVKKLYKWCGEKEPEIIFCGSPFSAWIIYNFHNLDWQNLRQNLGRNLLQNLWQNLEQNLGQNLEQNLGQNLEQNLGQNLFQNLWQNLWQNLRQNLLQNLEQNLGQNLLQNLRQNLGQNLGQNLWQNLRQNLRQNLLQNLEYYKTDFWGSWDSYWVAYYLFGNYIGVPYEQNLLNCLENFSNLAKSCGWIYAFENAAIICDRPKILNLNSQGQLHCDGDFAMEFRDGYGFYAWNGVRLPEKYGSINSEKWESKWLLEEKNAELRRVLIQGIGYSRICHELNAKKIDSWREYELLQIDSVDVEPIVMVKMTCPSTGLIHAHRVPPDTKSARDGISWINHGVDAEEFLIER